MFEDGQLTDGLGNTVDFKNTIIIMTSNIGARHLQKREGLGFQSTKEDMISDKVEDLVRNEVKRTFNPEFLNRLDETILFSALTENGLIQILELMVSQLNQNLAPKSITVTVTDEVKKWVLSQTLGDRSYGARPLRRALQKYVEDPLSEALIRGTITTRPAFIEVFLEDNKLYYRPVDSQKPRACCCTRTRVCKFKLAEADQVGPPSAFLGSPSQSPMRSLGLSLLQFIEVAADPPDLGLLGLLECHAYFAGLP